MLRIVRVGKVSDMASTVAWNSLRELASFRGEKGCAISFYLDLDPRTTPTAGDTASRVNSLLDEAGRLTFRPESLGHDQRQGLRDDLQRIRRYYEEEFSREGIRGLAVFCAGLDNFWRTLGLAEPVADDVRVNRQFYLAPLVPLVGRGEGVLVAAVGRERGDVYRLHDGRLEEVVDRTDHQPRRHDQGGRAQARTQRHIDSLAHEHLRAVAEELDRQFRRLQSEAVVVVCNEETKAEFADLLANDVRGAVVGWAGAEAHAGASELLTAATPVLERWRAGREDAVVERWREEAGRGGRATSGWEATLEAASDGRVDCLLYQEGASHDAARCPQCGRISVAEGACPLDGAAMEVSADGLDLAIHQALAHGGTVASLAHRHDLEPVGGIGALLRY